MPTFTLVTDALSPPGRREAASLAARGKDVVLLGDMRAMLEELASELRVVHDVDVRTMAIDLTEADATERVLAWLRETEIRLDGAVCVRWADPDQVRAKQLARGSAALEEALTGAIAGMGVVRWIGGSSLPRRSSLPASSGERKRKSTARGHSDPGSK